MKTTDKLTEAKNIAAQLKGVNGRALQKKIDNVKYVRDINDVISIAEFRGNYLISAGLSGRLYFDIARKLGIYVEEIQREKNKKKA